MIGGASNPSIGRKVSSRKLVELGHANWRCVSEHGSLAIFGVTPNLLLYAFLDALHYHRTNLHNHHDAPWHDQYALIARRSESTIYWQRLEWRRYG